MAYCQSLPQQSATSAYGPGSCGPCLSAYDPYLGPRAQTTIATNNLRAQGLARAMAAENAAEKPSKSYTWLIVILLLLLGAVVWGVSSFLS